MLTMNTLSIGDRVTSVAFPDLGVLTVETIDRYQGFDFCYRQVRASKDDGGTWAKAAEHNFAKVAA